VKPVCIFCLTGAWIPSLQGDEEFHYRFLIKVCPWDERFILIGEYPDYREFFPRYKPDAKDFPDAFYLFIVDI
jgi:hypothetical protein